MVDDVQKICNLILPEQEFWQNEARSLFVGVLLYLVAVPEKIKSFGEVVRTLRSDDVVYNKIKLIIQHAIGYKSKDGVFINTELNKYNDIYFYDDVDYIVYKDHFNRIFNELIYNT